MSTNGSRSADYTEATKLLAPHYDRMSPELRTSFQEAWDGARRKQAAHVTKLHLLRALLDDGRVRSHVTLGGHDIGKLESLVTDSLRVVVPPVAGQDNGAASNIDMTWGPDVLQLLSEAGRTAALHNHNRIDVWVVFDHLRADSELQGTFAFSRYAYSNENENRVQDLERLFHITNENTLKLTNKVINLEQENARLQGELAQARRDVETVRNEFSAIRNTTNRVPQVEARTGEIEKFCWQLHGQMQQVQGQLQGISPLLNVVYSSLAHAARPAAQPARPTTSAQAYAAPAQAANANPPRQTGGGGLFNLFGGGKREPDPAAVQPTVIPVAQQGIPTGLHAQPNIAQAMGTASTGGPGDGPIWTSAAAGHNPQPVTSLAGVMGLDAPQQAATPSSQVQSGSLNGAANPNATGLNTSGLSAAGLNGANYGGLANGALGASQALVGRPAASVPSVPPANGANGSAQPATRALPAPNAQSISGTPGPGSSASGSGLSGPGSKPLVPAE